MAELEVPMNSRLIVLDVLAAAVFADRDFFEEWGPSRYSAFSRAK